jgi:hypothetical protein
MNLSSKFDFLQWCYISLKGTHAQGFVVRFSHFWHRSIRDMAKVHNFKKKFIKCNFLLQYIIGFSRILRYCRKCTGLLPVFGENTMFHSAYSPKLHNSISSVNVLYTAKSTQSYSVFSPTMISLTPQFHWKRKVWLHFFSKNAQKDPTTHNYKDNAKFHSSVSVTMLSYATRLQRK